MMRIERPFAVRIARILDGASRKVADEVRMIGASASPGVILMDLERELLEVFQPAYRQTIDVFGSRILRAFKSHSGYETKAEDVFSVEAERWIRTTAAEKVKQVSDTTKRKISAAIEFGFGDSLTGSQVANEIMSRTGGAIAKSRAIVISRTEIHMAAGHGSQLAAESTGIPLKKVWISASDERTRETHSDADARYHADPIALKDSFTVGGDSMEQPGGGSDPAENINCRCVSSYVPE